MDARRIVELDIQNFIRKALHIGVLINPRLSGEFFKDRQRISSKYTRFADEEDYLENYYKKYEEGEYLAAFIDGAFLQINYEFSIKGKNSSFLEKMNLCYLPPVIEGKITNEYVRVDYSNTDDNSFFHPYAHIHIGFRNTIRIPVDEVMLFSEFVKMILYHFYPTQFVELFGESIRTTNTKDTTHLGKLTKEKILTNELTKYYHLKITVD